MTTFKTIICSSALLLSTGFTAQGQTVSAIEDNLIYVLTATQNTATLSGVNDKGAFLETSELTIPTEITKDGVTYTVTAIQAAAFGGYSNITKVTLPTTLKSIGQNAFSATGITEIAIPKSVSELGQLTFTECKSLKKAYIEEGTELDTIPYGIFNGCSNLDEVILGEGVTTISDQAFFAGGIKSITLPKTITSIGSQAFQHQSNLETIKIYAAYPKVTSSSFTFDSKNVALYVPDPDNYADFTSSFGGGIHKLYSFTEENGALASTDTASATDIFFALADSEWKYLNACVDMKSDVAFAPRELDLDTLSASNIFATLSYLPTTRSYNGRLNGATITNMTVRNAGIFNLIDKDATIDGLTLEDAIIYVDPTDSDTYETEGDDVTIHILAKENRGKVNFGFSGDIIVDEDFAAGKEISVCAINDMGDQAEANGYIKIGQLLTAGEGNTKRCITIKQNLGIKRPPGKNTKIATNKSLSNKSLTTKFDFDNPDLQDYVCAFTDEEFASGAVAYWLNYSGAGFTGEYTGYWAQGKKVPVPATTKAGVSNALGLVDYGETDLEHITSGPQFANNGSQITITYDQRPSSVTQGGEEISNYGNKSLTLTFDASKTISIAFNKATTPTKVDEGDQPKVKIAVSGNTIKVSGAENVEKTLLSITGRTVARTNGQIITVPGSGLYILLMDGQSTKVSVK